MSDIKYIIKRVIIGVAIVLVLGFINNAKASALSWNDMSLLYEYENTTYKRTFSLYLDKVNDKYYIKDSNDINNYNYNYSNASDYPYIIITRQSNNAVISFKYFNTQPYMYFVNDTVYTFATLENMNYMYNSLSYSSPNFNFFTGTRSTSYNSSLKKNIATFPDYYVTTSDSVVGSNSDLYNISNNKLYYEKDIGVSNIPKFISWNYKKRVNNKILLGYSFQPEFSSFDTDNYVYQYKVGFDSSTWLGLSQNKQSIDINANTILYVRVKDLQNNVIDGASFTVNGVGNFTNSQNIKYDINFTGEYRTGADLKNQAGGSAIIEEYQIYTDFIPNSSILKYQYQWVPTGSSLDSNSWVDITLSPTDYGDFTYIVNQNGTFYARILDSENNVKDVATFVVNVIGKLAIDSGNDKITNKFMSISNKLNIGGPISGIIEVPLKVINIIGTGLAGGLTCNDYQLGKLMGSNIVIPCVNIRERLGATLYNTIDIIIACVMIYNIYKMIMNMYTNFVFMQKNPVKELGGRDD